MFSTTSFSADGSDAGVRVMTIRECNSSGCSPTMSRFRLARVLPPSRGPVMSSCASMYAIVPYHSGTQRKRNERWGRDSRPSSISDLRERAMSRIAAEPLALSLADSLG